MSSQWLAILERAVGGTLSAESVEKLSLDQHRSLLGGLMDFHRSAMLPGRTPSQLRPRLDGNGSWIAAGGLKSAAPKPLRAMVKTLLLLADSVALQDPLVEAWLVGRDDAHRLALLKERLHDVAGIAPLIRSDVVVVYSPPPSLIGMNSGYTIDDPAKLGAVPRVEQQSLTAEQLEEFRSRGLQFDWDAAWVAHALTHGPETSFAASLALIDGRQLFFRGDAKLAEQVKGLLWEHRVRSFYKGLCDPGPMSPLTADLFCSILRLVRQVVTSRDEVDTKDYYFLLTNPLVSADKISLRDIVTLREQSGEFATWRELIRQSLDYAYHSDHRYVDQHVEFTRSMQSRIDVLKSQIASGRRGRFLAQSLEMGELFSVGGVVGLAQYLLQADLAQSMVAAPVAVAAAIVYRVIRTLCLENVNAIQAHYVAFPR